MLRQEIVRSYLKLLPEKWRMLPDKKMSWRYSKFCVQKKKDLKNATPYVPENLKHFCKENNEVSNDGWKKLKHWANWWTRSRHLQMFTKVYTNRDVEDWEETSNITNPVESMNRQSFKSRNNLNVILENIYLEDRIHAVKMAASFKDVSITYSSNSNKKKNKKRKRASMGNDSIKENDANGPPDKAKDIRAAKRSRRREKGLIDATVEVEYKKKIKMDNFGI